MLSDYLDANDSVWIIFKIGIEVENSRKCVLGMFRDGCGCECMCSPDCMYITRFLYCLPRLHYVGLVLYKYLEIEFLNVVVPAVEVPLFSGIECFMSVSCLQFGGFGSSGRH